MKGQVALIREQGQNFAVLMVKTQVVTNPELRAEMVDLGLRQFGVRTALLAEGGQTWGPRDIVRWLEDVPPEALPWREFWTDN